MSTDRLKQIEELYHAAVDLEPDQRAVLLDGACESDGALRNEVESLLSHADRPGFLGDSEMEAMANEWLVENPRLEEGSAVGPCQMLSLLGRQGIGEVYRARDTELGREVAVRILPAPFALVPGWVHRFEREARLLASLHNPHVCAVHDVGYDCGLHYVVMELVEGMSLARRLTKGRLKLSQAVEYALQIADALDSAHRLGVVHRGLKPGRIMLSPSGLKLLDFGMARLESIASRNSSPSEAPTLDRNETLGAEGDILDTLGYMAPEQLKGKEGDSRADIFAFGAIVYEMVTGRRAFRGSSQAGLIASILKDDPEPMASFQKRTPDSLEHLIERCLAKHSDERWQTVSDLMQESRWALESHLEEIPPQRSRNRSS